MSGYYRIAIKYKGSKETQLLPGHRPSASICTNFKHDLTSLGASLPKSANIHIHEPGSISLVFHHDENNNESNVRYKRYLAIVTSQNTDPRVIESKSKHNMDSISFTGPSTNSAVPAAVPTNVNIPPASTSTSELPTMSITYRFTITYKDGKAARLVPGVISEKEVCSIFKADLKTFEIEQPKDQEIRLDGPGSISFAFMKCEDVSNNDLYNSCMMLEMTQHHDHQIALLKRERSILLISLAREQEIPVVEHPANPGKTSVSQPTGSNPGDPARTTSMGTDDKTEERSAKRMRHNHWSAAESPEPGQILPSPLVASPTSLHGENAAGTRLPGLSMDAAARPEPGQIMSPKRHIKVEAPDESFALANSAPHSSPPRSRLPPSVSSPPFSHRRNYPSSMQHYGKASKINNLSRELWETRKEIATAKERERRLQKEIEKLTGSKMSKLEENEFLQERNRRVDIELRMQAVQLKLDLEQDRRAAVEQSLRDVERECREPFIVPALLKAFIKISQLSDAAADHGMNKERLRQ